MTQPLYTPYRTSDNAWLIHNPNASTEFPAFEIVDDAITTYFTEEAAHQAANTANARVLAAVTKAEKGEYRYRQLANTYWKAWVDTIDNPRKRSPEELQLAPVLAVRDEILKLGDRILKTEAPDDVLLKIFNDAYAEAGTYPDRSPEAQMASILAGVRAISFALTVTYRVDTRP
jgi:hypothetical protein